MKPAVRTIGSQQFDFINPMPNRFQKKRFGETAETGQNQVRITIRLFARNLEGCLWLDEAADAFCKQLVRFHGLKRPIWTGRCAGITTDANAGYFDALLSEADSPWNRTDFGTFNTP